MKEKREKLERTAREWVDKQYPRSMFEPHERSIALHAYFAGLLAEV